jgi:hypothetical protein
VYINYSFFNIKLRNNLTFILLQQKKKIEQTYSEYLKLFEEEKDVEGKKENYEILCHKIESIQAKLDAIASKLVDLEGDKQTNDDA